MTMRACSKCSGIIPVVVKELSVFDYEVFSSWSYDLTIQSMLVMIDAIHDKFNNYPHFYDKLVDVENPIITLKVIIGI